MILIYLWHHFIGYLINDYSLSLYRGRLIFTPAQNHQIVEKTRFFDVISTYMIFEYPIVSCSVLGRLRPAWRLWNTKETIGYHICRNIVKKDGYLMNLDLKIDFIVLGLTPNHKFWDSDQNSIIIDGKHWKTISTIIFQILDSFCVLKIDFFHMVLRILVIFDHSRPF